MISQTAEYALRAMVYLTECPHESQTVSRIAQHTKVPAGYLSKILKSLASAGLVDSQRGPGGGFCLARAAERINLLEIVNCVSPIVRIHECPLHLPQHRAGLCALHQRLDDVIARFEASFRDTMLSQLAESGPYGTFGQDVRS
ncbi:MAG: Rrf2 family transcriptional regulator [Calditrichaeota bacterium]|nr:Rrf2 family transcriptional regulator [Candidatus Cloacimonadota bacterium]MCA9786617.1 Rrf2 family transcriptional regulator [Candidatus Cloacimonadota bacterium]MCB1046258.1 Rrf2 family transcriptional regulator [Calditrichota bacterium]MCB9473545.1 Rrf2 family transcriptional regulator [Candidatus Delongbacteria bacterium]